MQKSGLFILMFVFTCVMVCSCSESVSLSKDQQVKKRIEQMFDLAKAKKYSKLANYLAYRGSDRSRKWKDVYKYSNDDEKRSVERMGKSIKRYLTNSNGYEFLEFQTEKESEGEWCIWKINFKKGDDIQKTYFACLLIDGQYVLGDID